MEIEIKNVIDEDFVNYKKPSMLIAFCKCTFKCFTELNLPVNGCANYHLTKINPIKFDIDGLVKRYLDNVYTEAIVIGGMEPFLQFDDLLILVKAFREKTDDDIVIYTGYYERELIPEIKMLNRYKNIIIKFGRYIPEQEPHLDNILGVKLASNNQYAKYISEDNVYQK